LSKEYKNEQDIGRGRRRDALYVFRQSRLSAEVRRFNSPLFPHMALAIKMLDG